MTIQKFITALNKTIDAVEKYISEDIHYEHKRIGITYQGDFYDKDTGEILASFSDYELCSPSIFTTMFRIVIDPEYKYDLYEYGN